MRFMLRVGLIVLAAVAIGGIIWGFRPGQIPHLGWIVLGGAVTYGVLSVFLPEKILRQRIDRRTPLSFDEIYRTSFRQLPYPRALIEVVWHELARDLHLDPTKIRPTDRFGKELSVKSFPLVDLNEVVDARLSERLRKSKAVPDQVVKASSIKTLSDYVNFTCRIESQHQQVDA